MSSDVFEDLRVEYAGAPLDEASVEPSPFSQFRRWFDDAVEAKVPLANGMTLATVGEDGQPSARVVLLKSYNEQGFIFFTSYHSRKARDLAGHGKAALLFWWATLARQIRIEGRVEPVGAKVSDAYFASRPRASNLSAMASPQSQVVSSRRWLEHRIEELENEWQGKELLRPEHWGGYCLTPARFEFWQGRSDRLHDRLCYEPAAGGGWLIARLAP